jgi:hypothetical protein
MERPLSGIGSPKVTRPRILVFVLASLLIAAACGGRSGTDGADKTSDLASSRAAASKKKIRPRAAPQSVVSTIQGNVSSVQVALLPRRQPDLQWRWLLASLRNLASFSSVANAGTALEAIRVSIDGGDAHGQTDVNGVFSVVGRYFGATTLHFDREEDNLHAQISLGVPNGASLFLRDVVLEGSTGRATAAAEDLTFDGVVVDKRCLRKQIQVASRYEVGGQSYVVDLAESVVSDASGKPLLCRELRKGEEAVVEGLVQPDGTIAGSNVTVYGEEQTAEAPLSATESAEPAPAIPASTSSPSAG